MADYQRNDDITRAAGHEHRQEANGSQYGAYTLIVLVKQLYM